jgi:hypothetical protein
MKQYPFIIKGHVNADQHLHAQHAVDVMHNLIVTMHLPTGCSAVSVEQADASDTAEADKKPDRAAH